MTKIVILGAGVMGSTLAKIASTKNEVTLVGSPLDNDIINCIKTDQPHPVLQVGLGNSVKSLHSNELNEATMSSADVIVLGVSSPGITWAIDSIQQHNGAPNILALVTKGLVSADNKHSAPNTYAQTISASLTHPAGRIVGIGGPCIARELALSYPTRVCFAAHNVAVANELRDIFKTDYYHIATHHDFTGLEACAALKNFMCIGVSAMYTAFELDDGYAKNPVAALFNQAVHEIALLTRWIKKNTKYAQPNNTCEAPNNNELAFDLAGMGDLHVTVGGGRNSKLGQFLGKGRRLSDVLETDMHKVTVEGVDTGKQLLPGFRYACNKKALQVSELPLTTAILDVIENDQPFNFDFAKLPG